MKEYAVDSSSLLSNEKTEKTIWWLGSLYKIHMIMKKREEEDGGKPPFDLYYLIICKLKISLI